MTRNIGFFVLVLVVALLAIVSMVERHQNQRLPLVNAKLTCVPPASHYQWKQRRIA